MIGKISLEMMRDVVFRDIRYSELPGNVAIMFYAGKNGSGICMAKQSAFRRAFLFLCGSLVYTVAKIIGFRGRVMLDFCCTQFSLNRIFRKMENAIARASTFTSYEIQICILHEDIPFEASSNSESSRIAPFLCLHYYFVKSDRSLLALPK